MIGIIQRLESSVSIEVIHLFMKSLSFPSICENKALIFFRNNDNSTDPFSKNPYYYCIQRPYTKHIYLLIEVDSEPEQDPDSAGIRVSFIPRRKLPLNEADLVKFHSYKPDFTRGELKNYPKEIEGEVFELTYWYLAIIQLMAEKGQEFYKLYKFKGEKWEPVVPEVPVM